MIRNPFALFLLLLAARIFMSTIVKDPRRGEWINWVIYLALVIAAMLIQTVVPLLPK
jgi:hypothetical protein